MKLFLIIVGALVTAFAICLLMLVLWLRWMTRNLRKSLGALGELAEKASGSIPPLRISLEQVDSIDWLDSEQVESLAEPLRHAGFEEIGDFEMQPSEVGMQAFCSPAEAVYAVIFQHPKIGAWLELVTRYEDDSRVTYSTLADTQFDRAENNVICFHEGLPAEELLKRFLAERPAKPMRPVAPEDFADYFERAYAESMDWMIARGGPTEEEIRRYCERNGQECTPKLVTAVRSRWAIAIDEFYEEQLQERFFDESREHAARWDELCDRVVFVHDRMAPDRLDELCEREFDEDEDDDGLYDTRAGGSSLAAGAGSPREIFARFNAGRVRSERYEKIGELSEPLAADVYLSPEEEEEE